MMHRSVRKKSLYTGDTSDTNLYLPNQVTQPIVHVLDEWAKVARNDHSDFPAQAGSARLIELPVFSPILKTEWLRHFALAG